MTNSYPFVAAPVDTSALSAAVTSAKEAFKTATTNLQAAEKNLAAGAANVDNGAFVAGKMYACTFANPKAKKGEDGKPRFTVGMAYMCVANGTSTGETGDRPPLFLVDNNHRGVNCGSDAKLKSRFRLAS